MPSKGNGMITGLKVLWFHFLQIYCRYFYEYQVFNNQLFTIQNHSNRGDCFTVNLATRCLLESEFNADISTNIKCLIISCLLYKIRITGLTDLQLI